MLSKIKSFLLLGSMFLLLCACQYSGADTISPRDEWMGIYMFDKQVGCRHRSVETTTFLGKPAYIAKEVTEMRATFGELESCARITTSYYLNLDLTPIYGSEVYTTTDKQTSKNETKSSTTSLTIKYSTNKAECQSTKDGKTTTKSIELSSLADFAKCWEFELGKLKLSVGDHVQYNYIATDTLSNEKADLEVTGQEDITISGKSYKTFVLTVIEDKSRMWQTEDGGRIKYEDPGSSSMGIRQSRGEALDWLEHGQVDLSEQCTIAVTPVISNPNELTQLNIRIINLPLSPDMIISDFRQSVTVIMDSGQLPDSSVEYKISASSFDPSKSINIPVKLRKYSEYLAESAGVEVKDAAIKELSRSIVGKETNAYKAASKLRAWVKENIKSEEDNLPTESATAVLAAKKGVCRHKALLYTALARAAGIPTRLVAGFTYGDDALQRHAWAESFVGEWVPFDPTRDSDFVDATHIKLKEGIDAKVVAPLSVSKPAKAEVISCTPASKPTPANPCPAGYTVKYCPDGSIVCIPPGGTDPGCGPGQ